MAAEVPFVRENVSFYEEDRLLDRGKLSVSESSLDWEGENRRFSIAYPNICLHAVSRNPYGGDENVKFPHPHIYLMVDGDRIWSNGEPVAPDGDTGMEVDDEEDSEEEEGDYPQDRVKVTYSLRFVPADIRDLDGIYEAIAECQALNPDVEDLSDSDFEDISEGDGNYEDVNGNDVIDPDNFADD
ncbi:hypothetical protein Aperf_G00000010473 [Anoplocephala perfoliata]